MRKQKTIRVESIYHKKYIIQFPVVEDSFKLQLENRSLVILSESKNLLVNIKSSFLVIGIGRVVSKLLSFDLHLKILLEQ